MSNRAGLRSPASAASRMRVASNILLDCVCCSGDNELHATSSATCMFLTVPELKCAPSAAMNVPKEQCEFVTLPEAPLRVCPMPDKRRGAPFYPRAIHERDWNVRFGSKADMCNAKRHVRFSPDSGHVQRTSRRPLCANSGHRRSFDNLVGKRQN